MTLSQDHPLLQARFDSRCLTRRDDLLDSPSQGFKGERLGQDVHASLEMARSEDGVPIQKQEEVYVIRYEKGVAYVRRWEDLLSASDQLSVVGGQSEGAELDSDHRPEETHN